MGWDSGAENLESIIVGLVGRILWSKGSDAG